MNMSEIGLKIKQAGTTGAKAVGRAATSAANTTKFKVDELSILSKRRDLINDLGKRVLEMSRNGIELPEGMADLIQQLDALDSSLDTLRNAHAAQKAEAAEKRAAEKEARAAAKATVVDPAEPAETAATVQDDASCEQEGSDEAPVEEADSAESEIPTLNI